MGRTKADMANMAAALRGGGCVERRNLRIGASSEHGAGTSEESGGASLMRRSNCSTV